MPPPLKVLDPEGNSVCVQEFLSFEPIGYLEYPVEHDSHAQAETETISVPLDHQCPDDTSNQSEHVSQQNELPNPVEHDSHAQAEIETIYVPLDHQRPDDTSNHSEHVSQQNELPNVKTFSCSGPDLHEFGPSDQLGAETGQSPHKTRHAPTSDPFEYFFPETNESAPTSGPEHDPFETNEGGYDPFDTNDQSTEFDDSFDLNYPMSNDVQGSSDNEYYRKLWGREGLSVVRDNNKGKDKVGEKEDVGKANAGFSCFSDADDGEGPSAVRYKNKGKGKVSEKEDVGEADARFSCFSDADDGEDLLSVGDSNDERPRHPTYKEGQSMKDFQLVVGMKFKSAKEFREVLRDHGVKEGYELLLKKNERTRITAVCKNSCDWKIHASLAMGGPTFQIKTIHGEHSCARVKENKLANYKYLGKRVY